MTFTVTCYYTSNDKITTTLQIVIMPFSVLFRVKEWLGQHEIKKYSKFK